MKHLIVGIGGVLVLVLAGGFATWYFLFGQGLNRDELREKYGPRYEVKRQQLKTIAMSLPPQGSVKETTAAPNLDPKPIYDVKQQSYNVEIAMYAQLLDPDVDLQATKDVDLLLFEGGLVQHMRMLGPKSQLSPDIRATGKALAEYESSLNLSYLVVVRPVEFIRPLAVTKETYTPGRADLEVFLVDLRTEKVVGSCRIKAETAKSTEGVVQKDRSEKESVEAWAYSTLWQDARAKLAVALREMTGGTFEFNRQ